MGNRQHSLQTDFSSLVHRAELAANRDQETFVTFKTITIVLTPVL